jgi:hypothetical protein
MRDKTRVGGLRKGVFHPYVVSGSFDPTRFAPRTCQRKTCVATQMHKSELFSTDLCIFYVKNASYLCTQQSPLKSLADSRGFGFNF